MSTHLRPRLAALVACACLCAGAASCAGPGQTAMSAASSPTRHAIQAQDVLNAREGGIFVPGRAEPIAVTDGRVHADVDLDRLTLDSFGADVPTFADRTGQWAVDILDYTCAGLRMARSSGEDGAAAVDRIARGMTAGSFFPNSTLANRAEALMTQLYAVTLQCADLAEYVGPAVLPGA